MVGKFKTIEQLIYFIIYIMNVVRYITIFIILTTIGILYDRYIKKFFPDEELGKHDLVRKYLLNEDGSVTGNLYCGYTLLTILIVEIG